MMLARNRVLAVTLSLFILVVCSPSVRGLGLGDITLHSGLNEPLNASIRLVQLEGLDADRITVNLASQAAFERSGIDYPAFLNDISFTIEVSDRDNGVLHLTTESPVVEPYLELIIDITWPDGRMMREYTMLVDPPAYSAVTPEAPGTPQRNDAADAATGEQAEDTASTRAVTEAAEPPAQSAADTDPPGDRSSPEAAGLTPGEAAGGVNGVGEAGEYRVGQDETLWEIARSTRPNASVSVQQMMIAIQRDNPQAFIGDNINTLRANAVLRIPADMEQALPSRSEALAEVRRQNQAAGVLDSAPLAPAASGPASLDQTGDELRILSSDEADGSGEAAGSAQSSLDQRIAELERQQMRSEEELDRARLENRELVSRLEEVNAQIALLDDIITLEDQRIAELQAELAARAQASAQAAAAQGDAESGTEVERTAGATDDQAEPVGDVDAETAGMTDEMDGNAATSSATAVGPQGTESSDTDTTEAAAGPSSTSASSTGEPAVMSSSWLRNPLMLTGLTVLLVALVVGLLIARRRRAEALEEADDFETDFLASGEKGEAPQGVPASTSGVDIADDEAGTALPEDEWHPAERAGTADMPHLQEQGPDSVDVTVSPEEAEASNAASGEDDFHALIEEADRLTAQNGPEAADTAGVSGATGEPLEAFSLATAADDSLAGDDSVQDQQPASDTRVLSTGDHSPEEMDDTDFRLDDLLDDVGTEPGDSTVEPDSQVTETGQLDDDLLDLGDLTFDENDLAAADDSDEVADHEEDAVSGQIDLAVAYEAMGDLEGARGILREVLAEGDEDEQVEARRLLDAWDDGGKAE